MNDHDHVTQTIRESFIRERGGNEVRNEDGKDRSWGVALAFSSSSLGNFPIPTFSSPGLSR